MTSVVSSLNSIMAVGFPVNVMWIKKQGLLQCDKYPTFMLHRDSEAHDMRQVLVWDIETVPDLRGFAAANKLDG